MRIPLILAVTMALSGHGLPNLPTPTFGGKQWWGDRRLADGWRIQEHVVTGHYRLLDRRGIRRAWGSFAACAAVLAAHRPAPLRGRVVLCLHGLGRTRAMWSPLLADLRAAGWTAVAVSWPSTREDLPRSAARLRALLADLDQADEIAFVTHSMGGPLVRLALAVPLPGLPPVRGAVFCFAPHRGAHLADRVAEWWATRLILGSVLRRLTHARAGELPPWAAPALCLAGNGGWNPLIPAPNDGVVAVADTILPGADHRVLPVGHTFGVRNTKVRAAITAWMEKAWLARKD